MYLSRAQKNNYIRQNSNITGTKVKEDEKKQIKNGKTKKIKESNLVST